MFLFPFDSNYARKNSLDTHVKQKHKEKLEDKAKVESPDNNDNQTPVSYVQTTEFDDIEGTKQFDCLLCDNSYAKNHVKSKKNILFAEFFSENILQISQDKKSLNKRFLNQICGFFNQDFLALLRLLLASRLIHT